MSRCFVCCQRKHRAETKTEKRARMFWQSCALSASVKRASRRDKDSVTRRLDNLSTMFHREIRPKEAEHTVLSLVFYNSDTGPRGKKDSFYILCKIFSRFSQYAVDTSTSRQQRRQSETKLQTVTIHTLHCPEVSFLSVTQKGMVDDIWYLSLLYVEKLRKKC